MFLCFGCFWGQSKKTSFNLKIEKALYALGEKGKNALSNFVEKFFLTNIDFESKIKKQ